MKESHKSSKKLIFPILAVILFLQSYSIFANDGKVVIKNDLPNLSYDHELLLEILEAIPMSAQGKKQAALYLEIIRQQEKMIKEYQLKKNLVSFYPAIRSAIFEIKNTAKHLFDLTKHYHPVLPTTLKDLILKPTYSLEKELIKRLEMSSEDREALNNKTKRLYAQQSYIARKNSLKDHLAKIKALLTKPGKPGPVCYVSYAWPSPENKEEYWVQPFLSILYNHLTAAGIRMVMDIRDNEPGASIYQFMQKYYEGNHVLLIGTESLLQKHYSPVLHAVKTELNIISRKAEEDSKTYNHSRLCPLLLSGTIRSSFPEIYDKYSTVRDAREGGYMAMLRGLVDWTYKQQICPVGEDKSTYEKIWKDLEVEHLKVLQELDTEKEISIGYHRQSLQNLKEDTQFQAVQAQEQAKHSSAVGAKIIGVLMESQGLDIKQLYSEYGEQYQRPSITPDFVERQVLWKKIVTHFNKADQQILTLSAHGLGGMGKTELARYYYLNPLRPYVIRAWFNAENKKQLYAQYVELAKLHGIEYSKEMPIEEQARSVKSWLDRQKDCLLVYDNVPDAKQLEGLLPEQGKHHILITSRNEVDWPMHQKLDIDVMEQEEAIALICRITDCSKIHPRLPELVNTLGYLPLALAQAGAYIAEKQTSIEDYLELYRKYQSILMSDETLARNPKHEPVWVTFNMNFEALGKDCPSALTILKQVSWLDASVVPELLLKTMLSDTKTGSADLLWAEVKRYIGHYSLMRVDSNKHTLSMHRFLQDILRSKQGKVERKKILNQIALSIKSIYGSYENSEIVDVDINIAKLALPHIAITISHLKKYSNKIELNNFKLKSILAVFYEKLGKYQDSLKYYRKVLKIKKRLYIENHLDTGKSLNRVGMVYKELGQFEKALKYSKKALKIVQNLYSGDNLEIANFLNNLGMVYDESGQPQEALKYFQQALEMRQALYIGNHLDIASSLNNIGDVYCYLSQYKEALKYLKQALTMFQALNFDNHAYAVHSLNNLGKVYLQLGQYEEALKYCKTVLKTRKAQYSGNHPDIADSIFNLGIIYTRLGQYKKALNYSEKGLKMSQDLYSENHPAILAFLHNIGSVYEALGKHPEALKYYHQVLEMAQFVYSYNNPATAHILNSVGIAYKNLNQYEKALEYSEQSVRIMKNLNIENHPSIAISFHTLGDIYKDLGKYKMGLNYYQQSLKMRERLYADNPSHPDIRRVKEDIKKLEKELRSIK